MKVTYLGRERKLRKQRSIMAMARGMRATGMPLKDALDTSAKLIDATGPGYTMYLKPAAVLPFRR